jgi:hypothetical protein
MDSIDSVVIIGGETSNRKYRGELVEGAKHLFTRLDNTTRVASRPTFSDY